RRSSGGRTSAEHRRDIRNELLVAFDKAKADHPTLKQRALARQYLHDHDPTYRSGNDRDRAHKEDALLRRVQLARKQTCEPNRPPLAFRDPNSLPFVPDARKFRAVPTDVRRFTVILPADTRAALRRRAQEDGNSESATARRLLKEALARERAQSGQDERE